MLAFAWCLGVTGLGLWVERVPLHRLDILENTVDALSHGQFEAPIPVVGYDRDSTRLYQSLARLRRGFACAIKILDEEDEKASRTISGPS